MIVRMSSKGQLVIPKSIRRALCLEPGTEVDLKLVNDKIILQPVRNPAEAQHALQDLYGMFRDGVLLDELKKSRRAELENDERRIKSLRS